MLLINDESAENKSTLDRSDVGVVVECFVDCRCWWTVACSDPASADAFVQ